MLFTLAYLLRLAAWGLGLAAMVGGPICLSWRWSERASRRAHAQVRHRLACGHFLGLLILPLALVASVHLALATMGVEISREPPRTPFLPTENGDGIGWAVLSIVTVWLGGACLAAVRLAADGWRLRSLRSWPAPTALSEEVRWLAGRWTGENRVTVRISDLPGPQVVGIQRSTLLVPPGFVGLPTAERTAVLLHELAHAARHDFAVNLLQRLILVPLWFQPAAWSLYRHLAREREACCDSLAIRYGASAPALARALVHLAEHRPRPAVAMAAVRSGDLGWRVHRLLTAERTASVRWRWRVPVSGALALVLAAAAGACLATLDGAMSDLYIASALGPVVAVQAHDPVGAFGLRVRQGQVITASVEERRLPPASILQHGEQVTLLDADRHPVVSCHLTPSGRIEWQARRADRTPRG